MGDLSNRPLHPPNKEVLGALSIHFRMGGVDYLKTTELPESMEAYRTEETPLKSAF